MIWAKTSIVPSLLVRNGKAAVEFYKLAFGAVVVDRFEGPGGSIFAALDIDGARLFVGDEQPNWSTFGPQSLGGTSVAIDLLVTDPVQVQSRAVAAGSTEIAPMQNRGDGLPLGRIRDPFGHTWLIGANWEASVTGARPSSSRPPAA